MIEIELLSLFPSYVNSPLEESILKRAIQKGLLHVRNTDIRSFSTDKWHRVDDRPFGGGPGMVLSPEPVSKAIDSVRRETSKVIYLSPQGVPLTAALARELAKEKHLILLAGHYEGIDQRVLDESVDLEVSIGDVVLTNGCLAALVLIDAVSRFIPGVLGDDESASQDSFEDGLLDCPHYTKPIEYHGQCVPDVLRSGDHADIALWRRQKQVSRTIEVRPDMVARKLFELDLPMPTCTFLSSNITVLRSWYKSLFGVTDIERESGFYSTIGTMSLCFLPGENSSWSSLSCTVCQKDLYLLRRKSRSSCPGCLISEGDDFLVIQDPENRLIRIASFV